MEAAAHRRRHCSRGVISALEETTIAEEVKRKQNFGLNKLHPVERVRAAQCAGHDEEHAFEILRFLDYKV